MSAPLVHVLIRGDVQGVGFRAWVQHHAQLNGLAGWVRNRRDGTVEAVFSGPEDMVEVMLTACRQGPATARVSVVEILPEPDRPAERPSAGTFHVLATV
jgi:acylphosphatase